MKNKKLLAALTCAAFMTLAPICEVYATPPNPTYDKLEIFARVLSLIQNNYVEGIDENELIYSAIKGMMGGLDPHSSFLTPSECKGLREDTTGEFGGVGVEVQMRETGLTVVNVLERTPASRAGIKTGDIITHIDGESVDNMDFLIAVSLMRGRIGSRLVLQVKRADTPKQLTFTLTRERIRMVAVTSSMLPNKVGYVKILIFQEGVESALRSKVRDLTKQAGGSLTGLILDLRKNPGGLLKEAVRVADDFISEGIIVSTRGRGAPEAVERAHPGKTFPNFPLIVLVDGQSASAAEIVAGALQDHKRALLVGMPTFGKGSVQSVIDMQDGSCAKITIARYYTPLGKSIQELGIQPDIIVPPTLPPSGSPGSGVREIDLERHFINKELSGLSKEDALLASEDPQLHTALRLISRWEMFKASDDKPKETKEQKKQNK